MSPIIKHSLGGKIADPIVSRDISFACLDIAQLFLISLGIDDKELLNFCLLSLSLCLSSYLD